jgi:hypothetical protein
LKHAVLIKHGLGYTEVVDEDEGDDGDDVTRRDCDAEATTLRFRFRVIGMPFV